MKKVLAVVLIIFALGIAGCGARASQRDIIEYMKAQDIAEEYEAISFEDGKHASVTFRTKGRELVFHAFGEDTSDSLFSDGDMKRLVQPKYSNDYLEKIREIYLKDASDIILEKYDYVKTVKLATLTQYEIFNIEYKDIEELANTIYSCDLVYQKELMYNDADWLKNNPLMRIMVQFKKSGDNSKKHNVFIDINASNSLDETTTFLYDGYNKK